MASDPFYPRFISYLLLFIFLMLVYVSADNLIQAFIGWEGIGIASFLLVNFWMTRCNAVRSAIKALLFNRIGDFGLCLAMGGMYLIFGSLDFATICLLAPTMTEWNLTCATFEIGALNWISTLLFLSTMGKSAQVGLHSWLSDAMEGPTPVSALIHAATMVYYSSPMFQLLASINTQPFLQLIKLLPVIIGLIVGPSGVSIYQETTAFLQLIFNGHLFNSINILTLFATITITLINYGYKSIVLWGTVISDLLHRKNAVIHRIMPWFIGFFIVNHSMLH